MSDCFGHSRRQLENIDHLQGSNHAGADTGRLFPLLQIVQTKIAFANFLSAGIQFWRFERTSSDTTAAAVTILWIMQHNPVAPLIKTFSLAHPEALGILAMIAAKRQEAAKQFITGNINHLPVIAPIPPMLIPTSQFTGFTADAPFEIDKKTALFDHPGTPFVYLC